MPSVKQFTLTPSALAPEIPFIRDVLYAMGFTKEQRYYDLCRRIHPPYLDNVHLLIQECGAEIRECEDLEYQRFLIAQEIVKRCPQEARSDHNQAYQRAIHEICRHLPPA